MKVKKEREKKKKKERKEKESLPDFNPLHSHSCAREVSDYLK